jgi:hypothetical protein
LASKGVEGIFVVLSVLSATDPAELELALRAIHMVATLVFLYAHVALGTVLHIASIKPALPALSSHSSAFLFSLLMPVPVQSALPTELQLAVHALNQPHFVFIFGF